MKKFISFLSLVLVTMFANAQLVLVNTDDPLEVDAGWFSSPYTCSQGEEPMGYTTEFLFDDDNTTYWHSDWNSQPGCGVHFLRIDFPEDFFEDNADAVENGWGFTWQRRPVAADHITKMVIYAVPSDLAEDVSKKWKAGDEGLVYIDEFDCEYAGNTEWKTSPIITETDCTTFLLFPLTTSTPNTNHPDGRGYWHMSEFRVCGTYLDEPEGSGLFVVGSMNDWTVAQAAYEMTTVTEGFQFSFDFGETELVGQSFKITDAKLSDWSDATVNLGIGTDKLNPKSAIALYHGSSNNIAIDDKYSSAKNVVITLKYVMGEWIFSATGDFVEALAVESADIEEGTIVFNQKIAFVDDESVSAFANIVKDEEVVGQAQLTLDEEDPSFCTLHVEMPQALASGDYKLVLAASTVKSAITEKANNKEEIEFTSYGTATLQSTNPMNNVYVEECPWKIYFMFNKEINSSDIETATIAVEGQGEMDFKEKVTVIDGNTLVIACSDLAELPSGSVVHCTVKIAGIWQPYEVTFTVQAALAVESADIEEGTIVFNQKIAFVEEGAESAYADILLDEEVVGQALLTYDEEDPTFRTLKVEMPQALEAGDYKLVLAAATVQSTITEEMNNEEVLEFTSEGIAALQSSTPQNNTYVGLGLEKIMLMFDTEINSSDVETATIAVEGQGEIDVEAENLLVKDGQTLVISCSDLAELPSGSVVHCTVKLAGIWQPYEVTFTVADPLELENSLFYSDNVQLYFNQKVALVGGVSNVTCNVINAATSEVFTQANLSLIEGYDNLVYATFAKPLPEGDYKLLIEDDQIMSNLGVTFAAKDIAFHVDGNEYDIKDTDIEAAFSAADITYFSIESGNYAMIQLSSDKQMFSTLLYIDGDKLAAGEYPFSSTYTSGTAQAGVTYNGSVYPTFFATLGDGGKAEVPFFLCIDGTVNVSYTEDGQLRLDVNATNTWGRTAHISLGWIRSGDADLDGMVTVNDYNRVKNYILTPATAPTDKLSFAFRNADANEDDTIDASDCEKISYLSFVEAANKAPRRINNEQLIINNVEGFCATANGNQLAISANNASAFMACQMDLSINADDIKSVTSDADHRVSYSTLENGMVRVLVTSYANETFTGNEVVTLTLSSAVESAEVANAIFTNKVFQSVSAMAGEATAISQLSGSNAQLKNGKFLEDGHIVIVRGGKKYTTAGQLVK